MLAPDLAPRLRGIERADSLAFDFHKWGQVPYDAGFILVRDGVLHRKAFATSAAYLRREESRTGGRLAVALRLRTRSLARLPRPEDMVHAEGLWHRCAGRRDLAHLRSGALSGEPHRGRRRNWNFWLPWQLNIVCFRYRARSSDAHRVNARIVADLQEAGEVAPSTTVIDGRLAIRAAIVNHRTSQTEIDTLIEKVVAAGRAIEHSAMRSRQVQPAEAEDWTPRRLRESRLRGTGGANRSRLRPRRPAAIRARLSAGRSRPHRRCQRRLYRSAFAEPSHRGGAEQPRHAAA